MIRLWKRFLAWYRLGYWGRMTDEKAQGISVAIFYELGAVDAGRFDDEWRRIRKQRGLPGFYKGRE